MSISGVPPPLPVAEKKPEWACDNFFQCSLVNSDVLLSAPTEVETGTEEILAAFFYEVPAEAGNKNLGLVLACADLTLYAVLDGLPKTFTALKQVCLPYGGVADVPASGKGGSVLWSDTSIQRILYYDRLGPNDVEPHMMRYARYVRYLAKPSFADLPVTEVTGGSSFVSECASASVRDGSDEVSRKGAKTQRGTGKKSEYGGLKPEDCGRWAAGEVEIVGDYKVVRIGKRKIDLSKKYKARAFLRFLRETLQGGDGQFYVENMRDAFNGRFDKAHEGKKWKSDRFREDLFKGVKSTDFELLFETLDQASGLILLKI